MKKQLASLFLLISLSCLTSAFAQQKTILLIQSYHPDLAWVAQCERGIRGAIGAAYGIEIFYMDVKRVQKAEFQGRADAAWDAFEKTNPDLVMIGDDIGLQYLGPKFAHVQTPVVYFGINENPRYYFDKLPTNITGVLERVPIFPWLRYLKQIMPAAQKALVLLDQSFTTEAILHVTFQGRTNVDVGGITAEYKIAHDWNEWKNIVQNSQGYDLIIMPTFHALKDENRCHVSQVGVIEWTSQHSPLPVFSHQDYTVSSKGTVGSYVIFGEAHGRLAGEMAVEILAGKKQPHDISPKMDSQGQFYFNQIQLDRFHLTLPERIRAQATFL